MGGPVEPLSGPGLQRGGGFYVTVEHREFAMMSSMLQGSYVSCHLMVYADGDGEGLP